MSQCAQQVDLNIDLTPSVSISESNIVPAEYEIDVDFNIKPKCCIKQLSNDSCNNKCKFLVVVDFTIKPKPCVSQITKPKASIDLNLDFTGEATCASSSDDCNTCNDPKAKKSKKSKKSKKN